MSHTLCATLGTDCSPYGPCPCGFLAGLCPKLGSYPLAGLCPGQLPASLELKTYFPPAGLLAPLTLLLVAQSPLNILAWYTVCIQLGQRIPEPSSTI